MRKVASILAVAAMAALMLTAFAQTQPEVENLPQTGNEISFSVTETPKPTMPDTSASITEELVMEEVEYNPGAVPSITVSDAPMTIEDMASLRFFDTVCENVLNYASENNLMVKTMTGTVTFVSENELQVNIPELDNDFCFNCVDSFPQVLGEQVTLWFAIQSEA